MLCSMCNGEMALIDSQINVKLILNLKNKTTVAFLTKLCGKNQEKRNVIFILQKNFHINQVEDL